MDEESWQHICELLGSGIEESYQLGYFLLFYQLDDISWITDNCYGITAELNYDIINYKGDRKYSMIHYGIIIYPVNDTDEVFIPLYAKYIDATEEQFNDAVSKGYKPVFVTTRLQQSKRLGVYFNNLPDLFSYDFTSSKYVFRSIKTKWQKGEEERTHFSKEFGNPISKI